jgi:hypothetical protein
MTPEEVRALIEDEIAGDWSRTNLHACDLRRCLVPPVLRDYDDCGTPLPTDPPRVVRLWLVLEEIPEERSGYQIVYSEQAGMFGLATTDISGSPRNVFLGCYGSFLETYASM